MVPASPASSPVPESGSTETLNVGTPRFIVALCWSVNVPVRPSSDPVTLSIAT